MKSEPSRVLNYKPNNTAPKISFGTSQLRIFNSDELHALQNKLDIYFQPDHHYNNLPESCTAN